jgi:hypothetical protein
MIKGLSNIIKENKKMRAIDKMLGCTCSKDNKPIPMVSNSYWVAKNCPIHGYRRFRK